MEEKYLAVIESICNKIKKRDIYYKGDLVGILLTGSVAQGRNHPHSDLDIDIIVNEETHSKMHICQTCKDIIVQIQIYSFSQFVSACMKHERTRPASYACKLLYDPYGQCGYYLERSAKYLEEGPVKLNELEKQIMGAKLKTELSTAESLVLIGHDISAMIIADEMLQLAISYYNDTNNYWMTNNNYLFEELAKHDSELGAMAEQIIFCREAKQKINMLKKFCRRVIVNFDEIKIEYCYEETL
ncbi:MAG: nucleotidyltransferase domain-containing protein [Lachnospiraceae bacterium]|jgi:predicted nucleotidyltransferase|nr:nucleotidyltransferase domain-containing protein [Lachnospiraceae bacterium]